MEEQSKIKELEQELEELKSKQEFDITVLMPTYNGSDTIQLALKALANQGVNPKVVVMDNGSEDGTHEMLEAAIKNKWFKGMHVELHKLERLDGGPKENKCNIRTALAKMADTKYTFWLDDDILLPSFAIRQMLDEIAKFPTCGIMAIQYQAFTPHIAIGATIMPTEISKKIKWTTNGQPCECSSAVKQIQEMGYRPMHFKRTMARDLTHL